MQLLTPKEMTETYIQGGPAKCSRSALELLLLSIMAGIFIGFSGATTNTAAFGFENANVVRMVCGLLFPFGLAMVLLMGAELFTGNTLLLMPLLSKKITVPQMLRNWGIVFFGNFLGALLVGGGCAFFGQLNQQNGALAVFTIRLAVNKCTMPVENAVVLGFLCNFLVTVGVLAGLSAKDVPGRIMGAYLPVMYFVTCAFEHSIANMYYISAGLFAAQNETYRAAAQTAGVALENLTWGNFLLGNLLPVTIGNILGGFAVGFILWMAYGRHAKQ